MTNERKYRINYAEDCIRIISFLKQNWNQLHFAHDCQSEYLNQILDYEEGIERDDVQDRAAGLIREMGLYSYFDALYRW